MVLLQSGLCCMNLYSFKALIVVAGPGLCLGPVLGEKFG